MAKQKINAAQSPSINKKLNTTSSALTSPRIETGVGSITNSTSTSVTFTTAFTAIPMVTVTGAGGDASTSTFAWPAVTPAAFNDRSYAVGSHSTSGFTVYITGAAVGASQIAEFSWIAIGA